MRRIATVVLLVVAAVVGVLVWHRGSTPANHAPPTRIDRTARVTPEQRQELATAIHAALEARSTDTNGSAARAPSSAASSGPATSSRPIPRLSSDIVPALTLEQVGPAAQQALQSAVPFLAECFRQGGVTATARMTMYSDPDIGTVIDTDQITDEAGAPLAKNVEDCMRDTIETLALPPLGVPGTLPLQYSFRPD